MPLIDVYQFARLRAIADGPFSFRTAGRTVNYKITYTKDFGIKVVDLEIK